MKMLDEMEHDEEDPTMEHGEAPADHDEEDQVPEISGWADAMSKILKSSKPKKKKMLILSRAKKDYEIKRPEIEEPVKKPQVKAQQQQQQPTQGKILLKRDRKLLKMNRRADPNLEVVTAEGDVLEPEPEPVEEELEVEPEPAPAEPEKKKKKKGADAEDDLISLKTERKMELKRKRLQKEMESLNRIAPDPTNDIESALERELKKVATKGVVELFNAVNLQKQTLGKKLRDAPKSQFKRDKIVAQSKDLFVDALEKISKKGKRRQAEVEVKEDDMYDSDDYDDL